MLIEKAAAKSSRLFFDEQICQTRSGFYSQRTVYFSLASHRCDEFM
jgi:hypothetical protein